MALYRASILIVQPLTASVFPSSFNVNLSIPWLSMTYFSNASAC